jgi:hypothetical protein
MDDFPDPRAAETASRMLDMMHEEGIDAGLEPTEIRFHRAPFGTLRHFERAEASWLVEGAAVLAWALCKSDLPNYFTRSPAIPVGRALGMFQPNARSLVQSAELRPAEEIELCTARYMALYWRLSAYRENPVPVDFEEQLREPDSPHLAIDGIELLDRDLAITGQPLHTLSHEAFSELWSIVAERYKALRWLMGWDEGYRTLTAIQ